MTGFDVSTVLSDPRSGIVPALMFLGWLLKTSPLPNRYIPLSVALAGIVLGIAFYPEKGIVGAGVIGFLYAAIAIGFHSGAKNSFEQKNQPPTGEND